MSPDRFGKAGSWGERVLGGMGRLALTPLGGLAGWRALLFLMVLALALQPQPGLPGRSVLAPLLLSFALVQALPFLRGKGRPTSPSSLGWFFLADFAFVALFWTLAFGAEPQPLIGPCLVLFMAALNPSIHMGPAIGLVAGALDLALSGRVAVPGPWESLPWPVRLLSLYILALYAGYAARSSALALEGRSLDKDRLSGPRAEARGGAPAAGSAVSRAFMDALSHELRGPLASVKGYIAVLRKDESKIPDPQARGWLATVARNAQKMERTMNKVLVLQSLEGGQFILQKEEVDLEALVRDALEECRAESRKHTFSLKVLGKARRLSCDPLRLGQVLHSLLDNARKYSPEGGDVDLTLSFGPESAELTVRDQGLGIPRGYLDRIFEPYQRVEEQDRRGIEGSGVGLHVSQAIVQAHGGRIQAESILGQGSVFTFRVPFG